eukprot:9120194-Lingulodinium_polyedra.AAC.1
MSHSSSSELGEVGNPSKLRKVGPRKARAAIAAVVQEDQQRRNKEEIAAIAMQLTEHPELIPQVKAMLAVDLCAEERLYRGNKNLGDIPMKTIKLALATVLDIDKSVLNNVKPVESLPLLFLWGSGKTKSWKLPEREMRLSAFVAWYQGLSRAAGDPLADLCLDQDTDSNKKKQSINNTQT